MPPLSDIRSQIIKSGIATILLIPVSVFLKKMFESWGILDFYARASGEFLKMSVSPDQVGWTMAALVSLIAYGVILWHLWQPRHIHHLPIVGVTKPEASCALEFIPGPSATNGEGGLNKFFPPTVTQNPELMPLSKAASDVYSELRRKFLDKMPNIPWNDPSRALGMTAHELVGDGLIPVWGIYPPGTWVEKVPDEDAKVFGFSGDATEMFDQLDEERRYKAIQIAKKDFERRRAELRAKYGA